MWSIRELSPVSVIWQPCMYAKPHCTHKSHIHPYQYWIMLFVLQIQRLLIIPRVAISLSERFHLGARIIRHDSGHGTRWQSHHSLRDHPSKGPRILFHYYTTYIVIECTYPATGSNRNSIAPQLSHSNHQWNYARLYAKDIVSHLQTQLRNTNYIDNDYIFSQVAKFSLQGYNSTATMMQCHPMLPHTPWPGHLLLSE